MKKFRYAIGSREDFGSVDELRGSVNQEIATGKLAPKNYSYYEFLLNDTLEQHALYLLVARGKAFTYGWCCDNVYEYFEEVPDHVSDMVP